MSVKGHSRHCRCGPKSAFVRSTPLATILGVSPKGHDVPITDIPMQSRALVGDYFELRYLDVTQGRMGIALSEAELQSFSSVQMDGWGLGNIGGT
jgi:hypothetical protein